MNTKQVLVSMLTSNPGTSGLDSGGTPQYDADGKYIGSKHGYGRHFERNQGVEFDKEPRTTLEFSIRSGTAEIEMTHNVYYWLEARLEFDETLDNLFHGAFQKSVDADDDKSWGELMAEFPDWVGEHVARDGNMLGHIPLEPREPVRASGKTRRARKEATAKYGRQMEAYNKALAAYEAAVEEFGEQERGEIGGIYGEDNPLSVNTYNGEDMLSQTIQYTYFCWGQGRGSRGAYVILQIHGGADVRGGYSTPHVFACDDNCHDETSIFDNSKGTIGCTGKNHHPSVLKLKQQQEADAQLMIPGCSPPARIDFDGCKAYWYTEDGCNFQENGNFGSGSVNLEDMEAVDLAVEAADTKELEEGATFKPGEWRPGVVCVQDGKAYCPYCGGLLVGVD